MVTKIKGTQILLSALFALLIVFRAPVLADDEHKHGGHNHEEHEEEKEGIHGGRMLEDGDLALEVTIFEQNVPPRFRVYPQFKKSKIPSGGFELFAELVRFEKTEQIHFVQTADYFESVEVVEEPHSFEVRFTAKHKGKESSWQYDSFEGRTEISPAMLRDEGVEFESAGPHEIKREMQAFGKLIPNADKFFHSTPRFPGVIKQVRVSLGQSVKVGEVIAVLESDQSLQLYELKSAIEGVVIEKHAVLGEHVSDSSELFVIADLSEIWADFQVYGDSSEEIDSNQEVVIALPGNDTSVTGRVLYVSPLLDEATQSKSVRAVLENASGNLKPGLFVTGTLKTKGVHVSVAVKREAIQSFRDWKVVFLNDGKIFQAIPVELGRQDSQYVEIVSGLSPGAKYVSKNSFLIKADIEKSGASHDH